MSRPQKTWGFQEREVAEQLKRMVGNADQEYVEGRVRGGGGTKLFRFTLNAAWSSGVADADILQMDGTDTGIDANVEDPLGIFSTLGNGDPGLCLLQGGKYYVIQAPCP